MACGRIWDPFAVAGQGEIIEIDLTDIERRVLSCGLAEWGGPAHCTDAMAPAMGFSNVPGLLAEGRQIITDLDSGRSLTCQDWTRALLATEIVFISDMLGSGAEWPTTTGLDDASTLKALRSIQRKLAAVIVRSGTRTE
jgi:hypothetical protein